MFVMWTGIAIFGKTGHARDAMKSAIIRASPGSSEAGFRAAVDQVKPVQVTRHFPPHASMHDFTFFNRRKAVLCVTLSVVKEGEGIDA